MNPEEVTAALLCGGQSSRMGFNKALLKIDDHYVLAQTAEKLADVMNNVVLVTNHEMSFSAIPELEKYEILTDEYEGKGPLAGLVTALRHADTDYVLLVACDIPGFSPESVRRLMKETGQVIIYQHGQRFEPLFALYHRSCLPVFESQLRNGELKIRQRFDHLDVTIVHDDDVDLKNVNTPEELIYWRQNGQH